MSRVLRLAVAVATAVVLSVIPSLPAAAEQTPLWHDVAKDLKQILSDVEDLLKEASGCLERARTLCSPRYTRTREGLDRTEAKLRRLTDQARAAARRATRALNEASNKVNTRRAQDPRRPPAPAGIQEKVARIQAGTRRVGHAADMTGDLATGVRDRQIRLDAIDTVRVVVRKHLNAAKGLLDRARPTDPSGGSFDDTAGTTISDRDRHLQRLRELVAEYRRLADLLDARDQVSMAQYQFDPVREVLPEVVLSGDVPLINDPGDVPGAQRPLDEGVWAFLEAVLAAVKADERPAGGTTNPRRIGDLLGAVDRLGRVLGMLAALQDEITAQKDAVTRAIAEHPHLPSEAAERSPWVDYWNGYRRNEVRRQLTRLAEAVKTALTAGDEDTRQWARHTARKVAAEIQRQLEDSRLEGAPDPVDDALAAAVQRAVDLIPELLSQVDTSGDGGPRSADPEHPAAERAAQAGTSEAPAPAAPAPAPERSEEPDAGAQGPRASLADGAEADGEAPVTLPAPAPTGPSVTPPGERVVVGDLGAVRPAEGARPARTRPASPGPGDDEPEKPAVEQHRDQLTVVGQELKGLLGGRTVDPPANEPAPGAGRGGEVPGLTPEAGRCGVVGGAATCVSGTPSDGPLVFAPSIGIADRGCAGCATPPGPGLPELLGPESVPGPPPVPELPGPGLAVPGSSPGLLPGLPEPPVVMWDDPSMSLLPGAGAVLSLDPAGTVQSAAAGSLAGLLAPEPVAPAEPELRVPPPAASVVG